MAFKSGRGLRALSAAFKGAGNTLNTYEAAKTARLKEEVERGRAEMRTERMSNLLKSNPDFAGYQDSIDPITGELDPIALEMIKEQFKNKRAETTADALAGRMTEKENQIQREAKRKFLATLMGDKVKKDKFIRAQGISPILFDLEENPLTVEELLDRAYSNQVPKYKRVSKSKYPDERALEAAYPISEKAPWWEKAAVGMQRFGAKGAKVPTLEIEDPLGKYNESYILEE